jgi:hypothetical protein
MPEENPKYFYPSKAEEYVICPASPEFPKLKLKSMWSKSEE